MCWSMSDCQSYLLINKSCWTYLWSVKFMSAAQLVSHAHAVGAALGSAPLDRRARGARRGRVHVLGNWGPFLETVITTRSTTSRHCHATCQLSVSQSRLCQDERQLPRQASCHCSEPVISF